MKFRWLEINSSYGINSSGNWSTRIDHSIVVELDKFLSRNFLDNLFNEEILEVCFHGIDSGLYSRSFMGPFRLKERLGMLIFDKC